MARKKPICINFIFQLPSVTYLFVIVSNVEEYEKYFELIKKYIISVVLLLLEIFNLSIFKEVLVRFQLICLSLKPKNASSCMVILLFELLKIQIHNTGNHF